MSDQDWRQKYLAVLEQQEEDEKHWRERQNNLQRLLVRVSLVAEGQDANLDQQLNELRELARSEDPDPARLTRLQEQLEERVSGFDEERDATIRNLQAVLEQLVEALRSRATGDDRRQLKMLGRTPPETLGRLSALPGVLEQLAELQERVLEASASQPAQQSLWQRLFGRGQAAHQESAPESGDGDPADERSGPVEGELMPVADPGPASDVQGLDLDSGEQGGEGEEFRNLSARLLQLLRHIQSQLALPETARQRLEILLETVFESEHWGQIEAVLDEVIHLIVAAVGRGQREFEQFLTGLDQRLVRLRTQFETGALDFGYWQEVSEQFDQRINQELDDMGSSALGATELTGLQRAVREHVERLNATLTEYREAEDEREQALRSQVQDLQEKVAAMEEESHEVREELTRERQRATTDMLTQLPNREALEQRLDQEYRRWHRYREPASLAIIDIDWFKTINDTYGHLAGDKVLQLLARSMRENLRETDYIARYGGEEFILLLPSTAPEIAINVLDKLREHIHSLPFHFRHERVEVTFSGGVTGFREVDGPHRLLDMADRALYRAKDQGRDRVLLAGEQDQRSGGDH